MADKRPLVSKNGNTEELRSTDSLAIESLSLSSSFKMPTAGTTAGAGSMKLSGTSVQVDFGAGFVSIFGTSGVNPVSAVYYNNVAQTDAKIAYYSETDLVTNYTSGIDFDISALSPTSILSVSASVRLNVGATITNLLGVSVVPIVDGLSTVTVRAYTTFSDPDEVLFYEIDPSGSYPVDGYEQYKTGSIIQSIDLMVVYKDS